ncbi:MAG TPA: ABC transporter permease [Thermoanaerobaculia bacterium]|nr:ABC transporter permease [Thermoanaerobaculia bacterium]
MRHLVHDLRHAVRVAIRTPFVSVLAIVAFALGIGVSTAVFSVFSGVLLEPLPYPEPERLVRVYDTQPACDTCPASYPKYVDWKERNRVFSAIGGATFASFVLTGRGEPERISAMRTTASLADVFGVEPRLGRWPSDAEDQPGARKVAVLAYPFWVSHFAPEAEALGETITLDGEPYEIVGVMPEGFFDPRTELFVPLARELDPNTRGSHFLPVYARLADGVTLERAVTEMQALGETLAREFGNNHGIDVESYHEAAVGHVRPSLRVLMAAVLVVLLIGCANVANLLLTAGMERRRELGIRLAIGARPTDLARQLTAEGVLLAVVGGVFGVMLASWAVSAFVALAGNQLPRSSTVAIDGRVLAFSAITTLVVGVVCGLWPLVSLRVPALASAAVREGDPRSGSGGGRVGDGLVVAEIALAFALIVGGGLLIKNLLLLQQRDAGIRTEGVVAFDVALAGPRYESEEASRSFWRELEERLAAAPGVHEVGLTSHLPMVRYGWNGEMQIEGEMPWDADSAPLVEYRWYTGDYFSALGIPLLEGRLLDARDGAGTTTVLINQAMAEKFWPGEDPIGRRFGQGDDRSQWYEVVGVVGNIRSFGLARQMPYEFYRTTEQSTFGSMTVVMRSASADPTALVPSARRIVHDIDPSLPVTGVQTMEEVVAGSVGQQRFISSLTGVFAALAAMLAMVGVYGVMAYNVRRQRRELGIRLALGAGSASLRNLILGRGFALAAIGSVIGGGISWVLGGTLRAVLDDVRPGDLSVYAVALGIVLVAALLASLLPAITAGRVDPMVVLRDS